MWHSFLAINVGIGANSHIARSISSNNIQWDVETSILSYVYDDDVVIYLLYWKTNFGWIISKEQIDQLLICKARWVIQNKTNEQIKITAKQGPWFLTTAYLWLSFQNRRLGERRLHSHVKSSTWPWKLSQSWMSLLWKEFQVWHVQFIFLDLSRYCLLVDNVSDSKQKGGTVWILFSTIVVKT